MKEGRKFVGKEVLGVVVIKRNEVKIFKIYVLKLLKNF